jgi:hypothetical protein
VITSLFASFALSNENVQTWTMAKAEDFLNFCKKAERLGLGIFHA